MASNFTSLVLLFLLLSSVSARPATNYQQDANIQTQEMLNQQRQIYPWYPEENVESAAVTDWMSNDFYPWNGFESAPVTDWISNDFYKSEVSEEQGGRYKMPQRQRSSKLQDAQLQGMKVAPFGSSRESSQQQGFKAVPFVAQESSQVQGLRAVPFSTSDKSSQVQGLKAVPFGAHESSQLQELNNGYFTPYYQAKINGFKKKYIEAASQDFVAKIASEICKDDKKLIQINEQAVDQRVEIMKYLIDNLCGYAAVSGHNGLKNGKNKMNELIELLTKD